MKDNSGDAVIKMNIRVEISLSATVSFDIDNITPSNCCFPHSFGTNEQFPLSTTVIRLAGYSINLSSEYSNHQIQLRVSTLSETVNFQGNEK